MRLYNIDTAPVVAGGWHTRAVLPGEGRDFDEQTARELLQSGRWSKEDPRAGLAAERAFKARRRAETHTQAKSNPARPVKE